MSYNEDALYDMEEEADDLGPYDYPSCCGLWNCVKCRPDGQPSWLKFTDNGIEINDRL